VYVGLETELVAKSQRSVVFKEEVQSAGLTWLCF
jgi:hypothetical protein